MRLTFPKFFADSFMFYFTFLQQKKSLNGVFIPITTPFNQDESIAWNQLKNNLGVFTNYITKF